MRCLDFRDPTMLDDRAFARLAAGTQNEAMYG